MIEFADRMGIKTRLNESPTLALGTSEVNLLELTNAYGTLVNQGEAISPLLITRIEDSDGDVLDQWTYKSKEVLSPEVAYSVVNMLEGVVDYGTAASLRNPYNIPSPIAAKTGTSQENADGWFVGMVPGMVVGVWVGWDDRRIHFEKDDYRYGAGNRTALPVAAKFFQRLFQDKMIGFPQTHAFTIPPGLDLNLNCDEDDVKSGSSQRQQLKPDDLDSFD